MSPSEQYKAFGFAVIRGLLSSDEVKSLREDLKFRFKEAHQRLSGGGVVRFLAPSTCFQMTSVRNVLINQKLVEALQSIMRENCFVIPDLIVQRNSFGISENKWLLPLPRRFGWHVDANSEGMNDCHFDPEYVFLKCGVYLQPNDPTYDGGVDLIPKSHRFPFRIGSKKLDFRIRGSLNRFLMHFRGDSVPTGAGDAVLFHSFLWHSSTLGSDFRRNATEEQRRLDHIEMPEQHTKFVIYFNACSKVAVEPFMMNSYKRAQAELKKALDPLFKPSEIFFCDYLNPNLMGIPENFIAELATRGIKLARIPSALESKALTMRKTAFDRGSFTNIVRNTG